MLQTLREASKSWVMKIILGLLALTFVVFFGNSFIGSGGGLFGGNDGEIVEVGDIGFNAYEISQEFGRQIERAQANPQFAGMTQEQAIQLGLLDSTISQMVTRALIDSAASDLGLAVSNADVSALVRQVPQFQNTAGRFDRIQFETFLSSNRMSEQQYLNQLRGDIVRSQLLGTINAGIAAPEILVDRFYRYSAERRVADYVVIDAASQTDVAPPDEAQIGAWYEANKQSLETPQYRSGTLVSLTVDEFAEEIGVSEADIAAAFEARAADFVTPERRKIASALFDSKETAEKAAARVAGGEDFASVVEDVTGLPPIDLGLVTRAAVPIDELGAAAFELDETGVSAPVESPFGWNLVDVTEIQPGHEKSLAEATPVLREALAKERARDDIFEVLEAFEDALAGGATLEEAAAETNLEVTKIGPIAANGDTPEGNTAADVDRDVVGTLFSTEMGDAPNVVERRGGGFFALRVDQVEAPRIPPLGNVRDKVVDAWMSEQRIAAAEKVAGEIAEAARSSGLTAAAAKAGYTVIRSEPVDRRGSDADIPYEIIEPLFEAKQDAIFQASIGNGAVVAQLVEIVDPPETAQDRERIRGAIVQSISDDLQRQLVAALQLTHKVDIDRAELQRLYAPQ